MKKLILLAAFFLTIGFLSVPTFAASGDAWLNTSYDSRYDVNFTLNNTDAINIGGLVPVTINTTTFGTCCTFSIYNATGSNLLPLNYFVDSGYGTANTTVWINMTVLDTGQYANRTRLAVYFNASITMNNISMHPTPFNESWHDFFTFQNNLTNYANASHPFTFAGSPTTSGNFTDGLRGRAYTPAGVNYLQFPAYPEGQRPDQVKESTMFFILKPNGTHPQWGGFLDLSSIAVIFWQSTTDLINYQDCGTEIRTDAALTDDGNWHLLAVRTTSAGNNRSITLDEKVKYQTSARGACGGDTSRRDFMIDSGIAGRINNVIVDTFGYQKRWMSDSELQAILNSSRNGSSITAVESQPPPPSVTPYFGTPEDRYQGAVKITGTFTSYNNTALTGNYSININITKPNGDALIDTVIFQINGTNFSNKGPPVNLGAWHDPNIRVYNKSVGGQFYINFTAPPAGTYLGFAWVNDTSNRQNQSSNFSGTQEIRKLTPTVLSPSGSPITHNATFNEQCDYTANRPSDYGESFNLNLYWEDVDAGTGKVRIATTSTQTFAVRSSAFVNPGGSIIYGCESPVTQNFTQANGANNTIIINNGTLPVAGLRKFINGLPRNVSMADTANATISANGTTVASFEGLTWTLYVNGSTVTGTAPSITRWFAPGAHVVGFNSTGNRNYSDGGNNSIYINVFAGLQDIRTNFNTPLFETNWTSLNFSAYINDTANIINVTAHLRWNGTNESFDSVINVSNSLNFTNNLTIPLINTLNNTAYGHNWSYIIYYRNGSSLLTNTTNSTQSVFYAYNFTSLTGNALTFSATGVLNATVTGVNKLFRPSTNFTVSLNFNGTTFNNNSYLLNGSWRGPDFDTFWRFTGIQMPLQTVNNTTLAYNASYTVQFGNDRRTASGLGTIRIRILSSSLGQCGGSFTTPTMGLFTYNESTRGNTSADVSQAAINNSVDAIFTIFNTGNRSNSYDVAFALRNNTNYYICLDINQNESADAWFRYQPTANHPPRSYFLTNATLSNATQEIKLFVLHDARATRLNLIVKDTAGTLLSQNIVKFLRYYNDVNLYETVTMTRTDDEGRGNTYIQLNDVFYRLIVEKDGTVKLVSTAQAFKCADATDCSSTVSVPIPDQIEPFRYLGKIGHGCSYTNSSLTLSCTWTDTSGLSNRMCLSVRQFGFIRPVQTSYSCVDTSAGTLGYTFADYNASREYTYELTALLAGTTANTTIVEAGAVQFFGPPIVGDQGLVMGLLVIGTMVFIGMFSPIAAMVILVFGVGVMQFLGVLNLGNGVVVGLGAIAVFILWRIRSRGGEA